MYYPLPTVLARQCLVFSTVTFRLSVLAIGIDALLSLSAYPALY
jgi:hypothetical protein